MLIVNPITLRTGTRRTAILRRHAQSMIDCILNSSLEGPKKRIFSNLKLDENFYTRTGPNACASSVIEQLYCSLYGAAPYKKFNNYVISDKDFKSLSENTDKDLVFKKIIVDLITVPATFNWVIWTLPYANLSRLRASIKTIDKFKPSVPSWGPHISIVRGEESSIPYSLDIENPTIIVDSSSISSSKDGIYYWVPVQCKAFSIYRTLHGLPPFPNPDFHLTIGRAASLPGKKV